MVLNMAKHTIQEIFQMYGAEYTKNNKLSQDEWKVYNAIMKCKTGKLGHHYIQCNDCDDVTVGLNSCRNRHCPMCQSYAREKWIEKTNSYLLNIPYFHIVTTIPHELNELVMYNKKVMYNILFKATSEAILELGEDSKWVGAKLGITSILHTWGGTMTPHPHVHSIVTGGGLKNNQWVSHNKEYLFKVQVLTSLFRGKFLAYLKATDLELPEHLKHLKDHKKLNDFLRPLYNKDWVTFIQPPKGSPENVINYIGRYAFRIAISNERIKDIADGNITFEYKDTKDDNKIKLMTISATEFIRRFLMHVLPKGFTKIKHYGLLANRRKKELINQCRVLLRSLGFSDFISTFKSKVEEILCTICKGNNFSFIYDYRKT